MIEEHKAAVFAVDDLIKPSDEVLDQHMDRAEPRIRLVSSAE